MQIIHSQYLIETACVNVVVVIDSRRLYYK